jgi:hypothetical protein
MRTLALTAAMIAATAPTAAIAADWVFVGASTEGNTFYIDSESIGTLPNGYKRAWVRIYLSKPDADRNTAARVLMAFDCHGARRRTLQLAWFSVEKVTSTHNSPDDWLHIAPETPGEMMLNYVCFWKLD